jgi:hypothetical protein
MREPCPGETFSLETTLRHSPTTRMRPDTDQDYVSIELELPGPLEQKLRAKADKAGLSLEDFLCKVLAEQLRRA